MQKRLLNDFTWTLISSTTLSTWSYGIPRRQDLNSKKLNYFGDYIFLSKYLQESDFLIKAVDAITIKAAIASHANKSPIIEYSVGTPEVGKSAIMT